MEKNKEFLEFVEKYRTEKSEKLINTIIEAFNVLTVNHPLIESNETSDSVNSESSKPAIEKPININNTMPTKDELKATEKSEVETEQINPELLTKVKDACEKITEIYKFLTGEEYKTENTKSNDKEKGTPEKSTQNTDKESPTDSNTPVMEEANTNLAEPKLFSFKNVLNTKNIILKFMDSIYKTNSIETADQIIENISPLIDNIITKSTDMLNELAKNETNEYTNLIRLTISNCITDWIYVLKSLDTAINQNKQTTDILGRDVIKFFNDNIYSQANTYIEMIQTLFNSENKTSINTNLNAILEKFNELTVLLENKFNDIIEKKSI